MRLKKFLRKFTELDDTVRLYNTAVTSGSQLLGFDGKIADLKSYANTRDFTFKVGEILTDSRLAIYKDWNVVAIKTGALEPVCYDAIHIGIQER